MLQGPASRSRVNLNDYIHELNGRKVHSLGVQDVVNEILVRTPCAAKTVSRTVGMLASHNCADWGVGSLRAGPERLDDCPDSLRPRASAPFSPAAQTGADAADAAAPAAAAAANTATAAAHAPAAAAAAAVAAAPAAAAAAADRVYPETPAAQ